MSKVEDIEKAIAALDPAELDRLRAWFEEFAGAEQWLRTEGVARYDAFHRGPDRGRSIDETFARLRAHHAARDEADGR